MKLKSRSLYLQARDAILKMIDENLEFMNKIPSESELSEMLGVSRNTIREAIKSLENDGYLISRHGVGTFITIDKNNIKSNISNLESITQIIINHDYTPGTESIFFDIRKVPDNLSKKLKIPKNSKVLYIERVRTANDIPVVYVEDYIPFQEGIYEKYKNNKYESLLKFMEDNGYKISFSDCTIQALMSDECIEKKLSLNASRALLVLNQIHYSSKGEPCLYSNSYFLSDKFEFNAIRKVNL
jgi:GntR family transcriptional regulator